MLSSTEVTMIRSLAAQGQSVSAIARAVCADRKTVRGVLAKGEQDKDAQKESPSILDPFKPYLMGRLEVADFTAQRLFQDLQTMDYKGGYDLVKRFVAPLRAEKHRKAVRRFETLPGQQAQVDWGEKFGWIEIDDVRKTLFCFSMVLGFSRRQYIEFTISRNLPTFLLCHVHAFEYFGGVTAEVLYDNLKTAVLSNLEGVVTFQSEFSDFASYYGFVPRACRPYRAQTKGKVERPFPYIRSNFFLGRSWTSLADLNNHARVWLDQTANQRVHGTTFEKPADRFLKEQDHLRPLPAQRFHAVEMTFRSSTRDCLISYEGNFYSVPHRYAARRGLRVEVAEDRLEIYHQDQRIALHALCRGKHHRIVDPKHLEGMQPETCLTPTQKRLEEIRSLGPVAVRFLDELVSRETKFLPWHLKKIQQCLFKVGPDLVQAAMEQCMRFDAYDAKAIENICRKRRYKEGHGEPMPIGQILTGVMEQLGGGEVQLRDLDEYEVACSAEIEEVSR